MAAFFVVGALKPKWAKDRLEAKLITLLAMTYLQNWLARTTNC